MKIIEKCAHGARVVGECRECKKIYAQRARRNNPGKYLWEAARHRAKKRGVKFTIKASDIVVPTHCIVLGIPLDSRDRDHAPSLDEIVQGRGYVPRNFCVISGRANRMKSDGTAGELKAIARYAELRGRYSVEGAPDSW